MSSGTHSSEGRRPRSVEVLKEEEEVVLDVQGDWECRSSEAVREELRHT